jgi:hypothetical protein
MAQAICCAFAVGLPVHDDCTRTGKDGDRILLPMSMFAGLRVPRIAAACVALFQMASGFAAQPSGDQRLTLVFARWTPGTSTLAIEDLRSTPMLLKSDVDLLRSNDVRGQVNVISGAVVGTGPSARAIVLLSHPPSQSVTLNQPHAAALLYLQDQENFRHYPANVTFADRTIELNTIDPARKMVRYSVELISGARQGGTAVFWR